MATQWVTDLAVEIEGDGPPLLMVHGLGGTSNTFSPQVPLLATRYRVIRPDLPGAGRTGVQGPHAMERLAERLLALLAALDIREVALVGHSMGTVLCQALACTADLRVSRMALLGPVHAPPDAGRKALLERAALARAEGMADIADAIVKGSLARETRETQPVTVALVRELLMRQPPAGYAALCVALSATQGAELADIRCPTLLVTGDQDMTSPAAVCESMRAALSVATLDVLPACGHWASVEQVEATNRLLERHFG